MIEKGLMRFFRIYKNNLILNYILRINVKKTLKKNAK